MSKNVNIIILEDEPAINFKKFLTKRFPNIDFKVYSSVNDLMKAEDEIRNADIFIFDIDMQEDNTNIEDINIKGSDTKIGGLIIAFYYLLKRNPTGLEDCIIYTVTARDIDLEKADYGGIYKLCKLILKKLGYKIITGEKNYEDAIKEALKMLVEKLKENFILLNSKEINDVVSEANLEKLKNMCFQLKSKFSSRARNLLIGSLFSYCDYNNLVNDVKSFMIKACPKGELVRRLYHEAHNSLCYYIKNDDKYKEKLTEVFTIDQINQMVNISEGDSAQQKNIIKESFEEKWGNYIINSIKDIEDEQERKEKILKHFFRIPLKEYAAFKKVAYEGEDYYIYGNTEKVLKLLNEIFNDYNETVKVAYEKNNYEKLISIFKNKKPHDDFESYISRPKGETLPRINELAPEIASGLYLYNKNDKIQFYNCFYKTYEEISNTYLKKYLNDFTGKALILVIESLWYTNASLKAQEDK